jgi:hypothetical protein
MRFMVGAAQGSSVIHVMPTGVAPRFHVTYARDVLIGPAMRAARATGLQICETCRKAYDRT